MASRMALKRKIDPEVIWEIVDEVHKHGVNRETFTIFVGGEVEAEPGDMGEPGVEFLMADRLERNLSLLTSIDPTRPITIIISSCGGDWTAGMQMFGAIATCPNPITVIGTKWCRSMTSIIPLAADKFLLRPPTRYMIHQGSFGFSGLEQEADTMEIERRISMEQMTRVYAARLRERKEYRGWTDSQFRAMLLKKYQKHIDVWYSAHEAIEAGFVDGLYRGPSSDMAVERNQDRRERMLEAVSTPITVRVTVT